MLGFSRSEFAIIVIIVGFVLAAPRVGAIGEWVARRMAGQKPKSREGREARGTGPDARA